MQKTFKLKMTKEDTAYNLFQQCQKFFPCWCWDEEALKKVVNDRNGDYEIEFPYNIEADEDLKNLSANDLKEKFPNNKFITLPERLKMEIDYFRKNGEHLDIKNFTLCVGSRSSDGDVPFVRRLTSGELGVVWCDSVSRFDYLRSRRAVKS